MAVIVDVQMALNEASMVGIPSSEEIQQWATAAISAANQDKYHDAQMTVRLVEENEISQLNESFRHKAGVTNVLSFPFVPPPGIPVEDIKDSLGDIVVCATVVNKEAKEQHKAAAAHWAHMIIHGSLHLLGYDHQNKEQATRMETLEKHILSDLGFQDPYREQ